MKMFRAVVLTIIGGLLYILSELSFRGHTHWTMIIVGGICGYCVGELDDILTWKMPFVLQCIFGGIVITLVEFISGCIINLWLDWKVWDYSQMPFNVLGQICLPFTVLWIIVCMIWIPIYDFINYVLFDEEKPHYSLIGGKKI